MNWFILALIAILFWSGSDLFSKMGSKSDDIYSHWKMIMAVGTVMGIHAIYLIATGTPFSFVDIITYLPGSVLYSGHDPGLCGPAVYRAVHLLSGV